MDRPNRGGRRLRTVQRMRETGCSDATIVLVTRLQQHLHARFGHAGTLRALVDHAITLGLHRQLGMPADIRSARPVDRARHVTQAVKRLSARLGSRRHPRGPEWHYVEVIVRCCCEEDIEGELAALASLWAAAHGDSPVDFRGDVLPTPTLPVLDDDRLEITAELVVRCAKLEADLARSQADNALYQGNLGTAIRANRVLTRDLGLAQEELQAAQHDEQQARLDKEVLTRMVTCENRRQVRLQKRNDDLVRFIAMSLAIANREVRQTSTAIQLMDPVQTVVGRVLGEEADTKSLSGLLAQTGQHVLRLRVTASPVRRTLALYLWICWYQHDPSTNHARLAEEVGFPVEPVRNTLTAGLLHPPLVVAIAEVVGADRDWVTRLLKQAGVTSVLWPLPRQVPRYQQPEGYGS
ncbi:hypothetical protein SAMN05444320_110125 [Streptoalloteichus hindustanus]|uniref:Uncharacterized protein n=2 Tax=Streptoalloteichus hindustanus TaxID=2017 RepID=A0A1M5L252_STRHI|nr:hypothetical protein SAMN05444320_110125 [Streptoalloteichus hindustanus]